MVVFEYLGVAFAGYALLFYLGWPLWTALAPKGCPISLSFGTPATGLAVLQIFAWYWLDHADSGLSTGLPILLGLNLLATVACLVWRRPSLKFDRSVGVAALALIVAIAATSTIFVSNYQLTVTKGDEISASSLGNNDIAAYAIVTQFVHDNDLHAHGPIARFNLGSFTRKDVFGVFPFVDGTAAVTGVGIWQGLLPAMLVALFLGVLALRDLARRLFPKSVMRATLVAVIASASYLFAIIQGHYFVSQVLAMAIAVGLGILYLGGVDQMSKDGFFRSIAIVGLLDIVLAFTYPHMLFLTQPVLVGAVLVAIIGKGWVARATRVVVIAAGGFVVTAVIIPQRFFIAIQTFIDLAGDDKSGFPLYGFTPLQLLGFQKTLTAPTTGDFARQGLLVLGIVGCAVAVLWRRERRAALYCFATVALVLASYDLIYLVRGMSYTQWKWISFFQPLYATTAILVVCAAIVVLLGRIHVGSSLRLAGGVLAGVALFVLVLHNSRYLTQRAQFWVHVPAELAAIQGDAELVNVPNVNVALPQYWDSMWATYFLSPRTVYLRSKTYYPRAPAHATWTLEPAATQDPPGEVVQPLNGEYKIVKRGPASG